MHYWCGHITTKFEEYISKVSSNLFTFAQPRQRTDWATKFGFKNLIYTHILIRYILYLFSMLQYSNDNFDVRIFICNFKQGCLKTSLCKDRIHFHFQSWSLTNFFWNWKNWKKNHNKLQLGNGKLLFAIENRGSK